MYVGRAHISFCHNFVNKPLQLLCLNRFPCSWTTARRWPCVFVHLTTRWMLCNIMGWGGVGMMTFRALDNMLDAMQHHGLGWFFFYDDVPCTWQHVGCYATSWGGVGWGWWRSVHLTTRWMLCNIMGWGGVGMMTFRALDNTLDATPHHGLGWGGDDDVPCTWQLFIQHHSAQKTK